MHGDTDRTIPESGETAEVPRRLLSLQEACTTLGITDRYLRRLLDAGELKCVYIGRRRLVPLVEIDAYIEQQLARAEAKRGAA